MPADVRVIPAATHGRFLVRAGRGEAAPFLVGFHGYLESAETQMARLEQIPGAAGWTLVSVQALHRVYRGRSEEVVASWMTRQDREHAIADNIRYVDAVLAEVTGGESGARIVHAGFSQGAAMAFRAGTRATGRAAGRGAVGADVPPELLADRAVVFPPVLLARGAHDEWLTAAMFDRDVAALTARGADVRPYVFDGAHEWTAGTSREIGVFLSGIV